MNYTTWKASLLALLMTLGSSTASAASEGLDPLPTTLIAMDHPTGYPDPICSKCSIIVIEDEESAGGRAELRIAYPLDTPRFDGEVAVTVWLVSGESRWLWLSDVSLAAGDEVELVAAAASDWSWDQVRFVWLRFVPT